MYPPPAWLLNKVAATTTLRTPAGTLLFSLDQNSLDAVLNTQVNLLKAANVDPFIMSSYQTLGLLLMECEAIGISLSQPKNFGWRGALLEVCSADETVAIAANELPLNPSQKRELLTLLRR